MDSPSYLTGGGNDMTTCISIAVTTLYKAAHMAHLVTACPTMKVLAILMFFAATNLNVEAKSKFYDSKIHN